MYTLAILSLIVGASALTVPRSSCSFQLTASGGESGSIGQLSDGQNRIGGGLAAATFSISNGGITDATGSGCILTPSVEQFQCDKGASPTYGFTIEGNGTLTYSGNSVFYACPASDTEWNVYTTPVIGQNKCVEISLAASGCGSTSTIESATSVQAITTVTVYDCALASSTAPVTLSIESTTSGPAAIASTERSTTPVVAISSQSTLSVTVSPVPTVSTSSSKAALTSISTVPSPSIVSSVASPSSVSSSSSCVATTLTGTDTTGNYQYPHLIIPVNSASPDTASGTQYFGTISSNTSTIFNFDIPTSYSGSTCNLIFLLPLHSELETSSYTSSGSGEIEFEQLSSAATSATTYNNAPSVASDLGEFTISEGSSTLIDSFACTAGETVTYELKAVGDTYLYYFQDWNPSPIGLFITSC